MKQSHKYFLVIYACLFFTILLIWSCKKKDEITGVVAQETYVNATGHDMTITRFMKDQSSKDFNIIDKDTLRIENSIDPGADSTGTLFRADSAVVLFDDGKTYYMIDTTKSIYNFLQAKRTISPNGKIHYYRYTFSEIDYDELAK